MKKYNVLFIIILFAIVLCIGINNVNASENYGLSINGEEFTSEKTTINCDTGTATYESSTNTLTLDNVTIDSHYWYNIIAYKGTKAFKVVLIGDNKIYGEYDYAIFSNQDLTISGTGSLYIDSYNGICAYDDNSCPRNDSINTEKVKSITFDSEKIEITTFDHYSGEGDGTGIIGNIISENNVLVGPFGDARDASSYKADELYQMRAVGWINYLKIGNFTVNNIENEISTSNYLYIPKNAVNGNKMHINTASYSYGGDGIISYDGTDETAYGEVRYFYNVKNVKIIKTSTREDVTKSVKYNTKYNTFVMPDYDITIKGNLIKTYKEQVTNLTAKISSSNIINLAWNNPDQKGPAGATGNYLYVKKGNSTKWEFLDDVKLKTSGGINEDLTRVTHTTDRLEKNTKYAFKIVPYYIIPYGDFKDKIVTSSSYRTTNYIYTKMNLPTVTKYNNSKVQVKWKKVEGASGYEIARSVYKNKNYSIVKTVNDKYVGYKLDTKKNKTYYYKVRAYKTVNGKKVYSPWSNYKSFRLK